MSTEIPTGYSSDSMNAIRDGAMSVNKLWRVRTLIQHVEVVGGFCPMFAQLKGRLDVQIAVQFELRCPLAGVRVSRGTKKRPEGRSRVLRVCGVAYAKVISPVLASMPLRMARLST